MRDYINFLKESELKEEEQYLIEEPQSYKPLDYNEVNKFLQDSRFVSSIERAYKKIPSKFRISIQNYLNGGQFNVDKIIAFINEKKLMQKVAKTDEPDFEEIMSNKNESFIVTTFFLIVAIFLCYVILNFVGLEIISKFNKAGKRWTGIIIATLVILTGVIIFTKTTMEPLAKSAEYEYVEQKLGKKVIDIGDTTIIRYGVNDKVKYYKLEDGTYYIGHF